MKVFLTFSVSHSERFLDRITCGTIHNLDRKKTQNTAWAQGNITLGQDASILQTPLRTTMAILFVFPVKSSHKMMIYYALYPYS